MSTTTQRPTPEVNAHRDEMNRCEFDEELALTYELAKRLERERDEAREQLKAMREAIKEAHSVLTELDQCRILYGDSMDIDNHTTDACATARAKLQPFLKP